MADALAHATTEVTTDHAEVVAEAARPNAKGEEFRARARVGLPASEVRRLSKLSPLRATLSLLQTFGLIALSIFAAVRWPHPLVIAASLVAIAGGQHGLAILSHQSAHYRMYETRWLNDLVGRLCAFPLGVSMITYRVIHRIHHNELYTSIDPDLALMAGYPRGRGYLLRKLLKDLVGITTLKNYLYFFGRTKKRGARASEAQAQTVLDDTSPALAASAARDRKLVLAWIAMMTTAAIATGNVGWFVLLWVAPLVTLLQAILRLRAVCEHGATPDGRVRDLATALPRPDPMRAARTTVTGPWVRWLLFPHHMNFHVEHHLYPSVPHYRLPACHRALQSARALEHAEVVVGIRETLRRVFADAHARA